MELNLFLLILLQLPRLSSALITSSMGPLCNEHDQVALLHFKHSISLDQTNCPNPSTRLLSWGVHNETNNTAGCCSWEGVTCEVISGHVTSLDLSYSCLSGPLNSTNPIFRMTHLQSLNLAGNDFVHSQIPAAFGAFSMLKRLNLSQASFSGSVPQAILELTSLSSLDLSGNPSLHLPMHGLLRIAQNMKDLAELSLSQINVSSAVPATFSRLTSLRMLHLEGCNLQGYFPSQIFLLPKLESLNLMNNPDLYGHLPQFLIERSSLKYLDLSFTNFQGELPRSIGNLISLQRLNFKSCNFSGQVPYTIGSLVNLTTLQLSHNHFSGSIPSSLDNLISLTNMSLAYNPFTPSNLSWIGKLTKLKGLNLRHTHLYGSIPSSLAKLQQIEELYLCSNNLSGLIPYWIGNLTRLARIGLTNNSLEGQIPSSIFSLKNLEYLTLQSNHLNGTVDISMFHEQKNIIVLGLAFNHLSVVSYKFANFYLPNLKLLTLDSCNLREFPQFLKNQRRLTVLSLGNNNISGEIPKWFLNTGTKTMTVLNLRRNFLTRFEPPVVVLPWSKLQILDLRLNNIHGPPPLPPPSIMYYKLSNNSLSGELSPAFCKANSLSVLDLSNNELEGAIPKCLGNMVSSLQILNLKGNQFDGSIPEIQTDKCSLRWISLSQNQLKGKLPRTLAKCKDLEALDVGDNQINDTFPSWLGTLPNLQVLILKMNHFHGPIRSPSSMSDFPELRIIDLSINGLTGALPSEYFPLWKAMRITRKKQLTYLQVSFNWTVFFFANVNWRIIDYPMSIDIMSKGVDRDYEKLSNTMVYINLSANKFGGMIPESICDLVGLVGLDLSNNNLGGSIPPSIGELKQLESLDLSLNMLAGEIPQQLSQLTFLEYLNVSDNNLSGAIPGGGQLGTFETNSFDGNPGLCGLSLPKRCGSTAVHEGWDDDGSSDHTKLVLGFEGFATGLAIGLCVGCIITSRYHLWFVKASCKLRFQKKIINL